MQPRALVTIALAGALFSSSCATFRVTPRTDATPPPAAEPRTTENVPVPSVPAGDGFTVAGTALRLQGTPYRLGGASPRTGFDCSGFVQYVYGLYGVALPRQVHDQFRSGAKVRIRDLEPGDLVFFVTEGRQVSHVGIAIGGDRFVHAPNSRGVVRVDSLATGYWGEHVAGARRVEESGS
jgi:cell wall-associated NlpC family hydrolase